MKKLGEIIQSISFSSEEKDRLRILLINNESLPHTILNKKSHLIKAQKLWRDAQRYFNIRGYLPDAAKKMVVQKALDNLSKPNWIKDHFIWIIYSYSVKKYVISELVHLNQMLLNEDFEGNSDSSEDIFRFIKQKAPSYNVTDEEILQLYEIWGFERIKNFETIINSNNLDIQLIKDLINKSFDTLVEPINKKITEGKNNLTFKIDNLSKNIDLIASNIDKIKKEYNSSISSIKTEIRILKIVKPTIILERLMKELNN